MSLLYENLRGRQQFSIETGITYNVEHFFNMENANYNLKIVERNHEGYIMKLCFKRNIKLSASQATVFWSFMIDGAGEKVGKWSKPKW